MESYFLKSGELPRDLISQFGRELTFRERSSKKAYGIGFFKPSPGSRSILSEWYAVNNNVIRPHMDQLTQGLIIRLTGIKEINALLIGYSEIEKIIIKKQPESVTPIIGSPFWMLLKLGVKPRIARWVTWGSTAEYDFGDVNVEFLTRNGNLNLIWKGEHFGEVKQFFGSEYVERFVEIRH